MASTVVKTRCPAKVNLTFEILGLLPDGYHEVLTLLQTVSLEDELSFRFSERGADEHSKPEKHQDVNPDEQSDEQPLTPPNSVQTSTISYDSYESEFSAEFPTNDSNLISKAIRKYQEAVPESQNINVSIDVVKRIPMGAGLAGGSANAAAALVAINHFCQNKLTHAQLLELGATLGADVPFSLQGGTCIGTHKGDVLKTLSGAAKLFLLLAKPQALSVSTPWAFKQLDALTDGDSARPGTAGSAKAGTATAIGSATEKCTSALITTSEVSHSNGSLPPADQSKLNAVAKHLKNDLEKVVFEEHEELKAFRQTMEQHGAIAARLTGSGPTLYAIVESREKAQKLKEDLIKFQSNKNDSKIFPLDFWITESISCGARVIEE